MKELVSYILKDVVISISGEIVVVQHEEVPEIIAPQLINVEIPLFGQNYILISFDKELDNSVTLSGSYFKINQNGNELTSLLVEYFDTGDDIPYYGSLLVFGVDPIFYEYGDIVTISYTKPETNPLKGINGAEVESFIDYPVTNNIEAPE